MLCRLRRTFLRMRTQDPTSSGLGPYTLSVGRCSGPPSCSKLLGRSLAELTPLPIRVLGHSDILPRRCKTS
jgi:hypothetical protein